MAFYAEMPEQVRAGGGKDNIVIRGSHFTKNAILIYRYLIDCFFQMKISNLEKMQSVYTYS